MMQNWWYKTLWKWNFLLKIKLFGWLALENKILTGDNYIKRGGVGPIFCLMCGHDAEIVFIY